LDNEPEPYVIYAPNRVTGRPIEVAVTYQEIAHCIDKTIGKIEYALMNALEKLPAELYSDIVRNGIWLAGGGALIRGLDKRLNDKIKEEVGIPFHVADEPLLSVARGVGIALENTEEYQSCLMR
jgi:rod shape-determining protein MreB